MNIFTIASCFLKQIFIIIFSLFYHGYNLLEAFWFTENIYSCTIISFKFSLLDSCKENLYTYMLKYSNNSLAHS